MPYQLTNAYNGSGMKTAQVYDPSQEWAQAGASHAQAGWDLPLQKQLIQQQQAPEMAKLGMQQQHWNSLFPFLQNAFNGNFSQTVGGHSGRGPHISGGPVYDQQMQQQQINGIRAQGDQTTQGNIQQMQGKLAGSGFGARSPLAAALSSQMQMSNMGNTANTVRDYRQQAAGQNANHSLQAQQAQEQQYSNRMQEDIARRRNLVGYQTGLLGALGQFI